MYQSLTDDIMQEIELVLNNKPVQEFF